MGTCKVLDCYFDPPFLPDDSDILTSYQITSQSQYDKLDKKEFYISTQNLPVFVSITSNSLRQKNELNYLNSFSVVMIRLPFIIILPVKYTFPDSYTIFYYILSVTCKVLKRIIA